MKRTLSHSLYAVLSTALRLTMLTLLIACGALSAPAVAQTIKVANAQAPEPATGSTNMVFTVALDAAAAQVVSVDFATATDSGGANPATASTDYTTTSGTVVFAVGQTIRTINVPVLADAQSPETNETFLVNLFSPFNATISDAQATGTITQGATPGTLLISELRTSGPGGSGDDYVEIYNSSNTAHMVAATDGSAGYSLVASNNGDTGDPVIVGTIPNGTEIPAHGHFLFTGSAYSLANYGGTGAATNDVTLVADLNQDVNIGLFSTSNLSNLSTVNRFDAVGFGLNTNGLYDLLRERSTLNAAMGSTSEYAFVRKYRRGAIVDTGVNADDFEIVSTTPATAVGDNLMPMLGAPGPQNLGSPLDGAAGGTATLIRSLFDPNVSVAGVPNTERSSVTTTNGQFGTMRFRRTFTNNTGQDITRLRFRIYELTTVPTSGTADLRALTSSDEAAVATSIGPKSTKGTTLETPPAQPNGGGVNSSLTVTLGTPLSNGNSLDLNLLFGVQQTGSYRIAIIAETLPGSSRQALWIMTGDTEAGGTTEQSNVAPAVTTNTGLTLQANATATIDNTRLNVLDTDGDAFIFTLTPAPTLGTLELNNVALAVNDTFTQADIDSNLLTYTAGATIGADSFGFTAADAFGGSVRDTFSIAVAEAPSLVVTTASDASTNIDGLTSLREAITFANSNPDTSTITFDISGAGPHAIQPTAALPDLSTDIEIQGHATESVTVRGEGAADPYGIFIVNSGLTVSISNLTITNGQSTNGGAILNNGSTLNLLRCTLSGNTAQEGGAIFNESGSIAMENCTLSGNSASLSGGGIYSNQAIAFVTLNSCTIAGNVADSDNNNAGVGGGIRNELGTVVLTNTLVAGNTRRNDGSSESYDVHGQLSASSAFSLVGVDTGMTGVADNTNDNQVGTAASPIDVKLGPLQNNGGPTFTRGLLTGSPAIDAGNTALTGDQRGVSRPQVTDDDIGAYEARQGLALNGLVRTNTLAPINGVAVTLTETQSGATIDTSSTNTSGAFSFSSLAEGYYTVAVSKTGFTFTTPSQTLRISNTSRAVNFVGAPTMPVYNLSGRISDSSGAGIANVSVTLTSVPDAVVSPVLTNSAGYYSFVGVPNDNYTVTPAKSGYFFTPSSKNVTVNGANLSGQNFIGSTGYTVSGRIATSSGVGISGVTVTLDGGATATSNSAGYYTFYNVASGDHTLTPSKSGYSFVPSTKNITVSGANLSGQNFTGSVL